ncbi:MAG: phosphoribosylformylglycinamidine synthase subunit PurS [candidate division Zixibacteria bacterium]|nr:phosphoribosylformylglycinamidine synthase subunit PurS [candidate division Zixibacteria bacterium]
MSKYTAKVEVKFKSGVLDPQGETIKNALYNLDYNMVESVKTGKVFWIDLESDSTSKALKTVNELTDKLLANPIIEKFEVEIEK